MSLARFDWTARARPFVELGIGDTRANGTGSVWDIARWSGPANRLEPVGELAADTDGDGRADGTVLWRVGVSAASAVWSWTAAGQRITVTGPTAVLSSAGIGLLERAQIAGGHAHQLEVAHIETALSAGGTFAAAVSYYDAAGVVIAGADQLVTAPMATTSSSSSWLLPAAPATARTVQVLAGLRWATGAPAGVVSTTIDRIALVDQSPVVSTWAGTEPSWVDVTCECYSYRVEYGRRRTTDRFVPGVGTILIDNSSGWADPNTDPAPFVLSVRPGRAIRVGVDHEVLGRRVLFRGFIDSMVPTYTPDSVPADLVELTIIDALGEVSRAKQTPVADPLGEGESVSARINRLLDMAAWPVSKRDVWAGSTALIGDVFAGQMADMLGRAADSAGGSVFGDYEGRVAFRPRDWQAFRPTDPPDGTIGNVEPDDVCPVSWERPFARADMATRVIVGRDLETAQTFDDLEGQAAYGIEPFERTDLQTQADSALAILGERYLRTRSAATSPRVRSVMLDARNGDAQLDLMTSVDVYLPSRYRARLELERGEVFDEELFATGVVHEVTPSAWSLALNLDSARPFAAPGGRWDLARWDKATWTAAVIMLEELEQLLNQIEVPT